MRRIAVAVISALGLLSLPVTAAYADPSPAPIILPSAVPGTPVCQMTQEGQFTGIVATADGYAVTNAHGVVAPLKVYLYDGSCKKQVKTLTYSGDGAADPQGITIDAQGNYWVSDTGLSGATTPRAKVAAWKFPANGGKSVLYRFSFPANPVTIAAMVMNGDGTPVFVGQSTGGAANLYAPSGALDPAGNAVPLKQVGQFTPLKTGTANKLGGVGQSQVTDATNSPDGKKVVIRTYSDAYEFDVTNGDVVSAISKTTAKVTPLPNEDGGVGITYSHDGAVFVTLSAPTGQGLKSTILKYSPATAVPGTVKSSTPASMGSAAATGKAKSFFSNLSLQQITMLIGALGVLGLIMIIAGAIGIRIARNRPQPPSLDEPAGKSPWEPEPVTARASSSGVYGRSADPAYPDERYAAAQYGQPADQDGAYYGSGGYDQSGYDDRYADQRGYQDQRSGYDDRRSGGYDQRYADQRGYEDPRSGYDAYDRGAPQYDQRPPDSYPPNPRPPMPPAAPPRGSAQPSRGTAAPPRGSGYADPNDGYGDGW
jgi:hypothetical protein